MSIVQKDLIKNKTTKKNRPYAQYSNNFGNLQPKSNIYCNTYPKGCLFIIIQLETVNIAVLNKTVINFITILLEPLLALAYHS